ncbi:MAG: peptidylprolyl isomerase [Candidatus Omnitrophica bacterium]|nr:peptidylprolyl isomerase [Candidatus Omnitrophota bacterium]
MICLADPNDDRRFLEIRKTMLKKMFLTFLFPLLAFGVLTFCGETASAQMQNPKGQLFLKLKRLQPALLVNGATITHGQIEDRMNRLKRRDFLSSHKVVEDMAPAAIREYARDLLIDEYIALQLAAKENIEVSTEEVVGALQGLAARAGNAKDFNRILHEQGLLNEGLMGEGLKNFYIDKLRQQYAQTLPSPSTSELRDFYEAHRIVFQTTPERVYARQIFLVRPENVRAFSEEDMKIRERLKELIQRLKEGEDFKKLADRYTEDPNGIGKGGAIGWVVPGIGDRLLEPFLFSMEPGEILETPVELVGGYSIPTIDKREEAVYVPFEEATDRVLKGWQIEKFKEWIAEERKNATIEYFEKLPQKDILAGKKPKKTYID